ncbi:ABC transporter substrate-binding protein [Haloferax sp. ATB1]|uniref:ABC transporter substrate-binding protein n=1 Tax=Haloferax sp. ATB1 TaxID=1508454 RepID=UPI0005B2198C|nr:ABC transporter substrate-binding protein [Haloferax sp. ATB1]
MNLEGSMFVPVFFYGREQNLWEDRGIDLKMEVTGFGKFTRTFSQNLATGVSPLSSLPMATNLAGDTPVKCFGQTMNFINQCFVPAGSDIEKPEDLEGKVLGVPGRGSSTTRYYVAQWAELFGFDLLNDPEEIVDSSTSTLYNFLDEGKEVDAALLFTSSTIKALANDDLRSIYDPVPQWKEQSGYPPSVTMFGVYDDFLESNPQAVLDFWEGWAEAVELFRDEFDSAISQYGAVGGIDLSSEGETEVVRQMVNNGELFPTEWNEEWVQANADLWKLVAEQGGIESAPGTDQFLTTEDLENKVN